MFLFPGQPGRHAKGLHDDLASRRFNRFVGALLNERSYQHVDTDFCYICYIVYYNYIEWLYIYIYIDNCIYTYRYRYMMLVSQIMYEKDGILLNRLLFKFLWDTVLVRCLIAEFTNQRTVSDDVVQYLYFLSSALSFTAHGALYIKSLLACTWTSYVDVSQDDQTVSSEVSVPQKWSLRHVYQFVYRHHSSEHPHRQSHDVSLQVELPSRGQFSRRCRQHRWKAAQWEVVSFWTLRSSATRGPLLEPWTRWNPWHIVGCDGHGLLRSLPCLFMTRENLLHHCWMISYCGCCGFDLEIDPHAAMIFISYFAVPGFSRCIYYGNVKSKMSLFTPNKSIHLSVLEIPSTWTSWLTLWAHFWIPYTQVFPPFLPLKK